MNTNLTNLRLTYMACLTVADQTDSKKEERQLRNESAEALEELRAICPHKHVVILQSAYTGSYTYDYDDYQRGYRICLMCGVEESSHDKFTLLRNPFSRFEGRAPLPVREPLKYLLTDCIAAAEKGYPPRCD